MKKLWKNPLVYALCAVIPMSAAMTMEVPSLVGARESLIDAPDAISRINRHVVNIREELLVEDHTDTLIAFDRFSKSLKDAYLKDKTLEEGDVHQILEAVSFSQEFHLGQKNEQNEPAILGVIGKAQMLLDQKADRDVIVAALLQDTTTSADASLQEIQEGFGKNVADLVEKGE